MKWVGQHIWDFISRFRNDVYLEDISTGTIASGGNLGLDANNKIVKSANPAGTIDLTSEVTNVLPVANGGTGASSLADNSILTGTGTSAITAESTLTYDDGNLQVLSTTSERPIIQLVNDNSDALPSDLRFYKYNFSAGADGDKLGRIVFVGRDDSNAVQFYSSIVGSIADATNGQEAGKLELKVAEYDGSGSAISEGTTGLLLDGDTNADGEVDVTIGAGAASTTTIAGTLTMGSTAFANNNGVIQVATQGTIDHDSLANFVAAEHVDWASASAGTIHSTNIPTLNQNTTGQAGTVATITGLAPDTATTQATQPNITTMTGFVTGSANQLLTDDGDGTVTSEAGLTWDGDELDIISSTSGRPQVTIKNTNSNPKGPGLMFVNDKGAAGALNDEAGTILFRGDNASQTPVDYGRLSTNATSVIASAEAGSIALQARSSNGSSSTLRNVITGTGSPTANDVDVEIGYGTTSVTTVAGDAVITGNIELGNASDTTIARSAAGTVTIEGNEIQTKNVHHHFLNAGFFLNFPFSRYIPLNGSLSEQNTTTASPEYVNFTWPYDGFVKKMMLRTETDMGSTELKLYKGASGATVTTALGAVTQTVDASDAVEFDFTSVTNTYSKGDTMAVRIDPTDDPDGGQNITIELVFDLTT